MPSTANLDRVALHVILFTLCSHSMKNPMARTSRHSPPSSPVFSDSAVPGIREKLPPDRIALMRDWVECTNRSFRRIARELGVSVATVSRYAAAGGWKRPPRRAAIVPHFAAAQPPDAFESEPAAPQRASDRRGQIVDRLWALAERQADMLEAQPIERAERILQPLARLTRTLGEIDRHAPAPSPPDEPPDFERPGGRSLNELRDELAAHLDRIMQEEGYGWEEPAWWFEDGAGI